MADRLRSVFDRAVRAAELRSYLRGQIGRINPDGSVSLRVPGRPNYLYVQIDGRGVSIARNTGVPRRFGLPVLLREERGVLVIHGVDYSDGRLDAFLGSGGLAAVNYHTHRPGSGLEYVTPAQLMEPGLVQPAGGMTVYINPFRYFTGTDWDTWEGGTLDLTLYQPATPDTWAWVLVGVDPETNTAVAAAGSEVSTGTALAIGDIDAITFDGYIPCGAVRVRADDAKLTDISRYVDARGWLNLGGGGGALDDLSDVNAPSPNDADVLTYDAGAGEWVAAQPIASKGAAYAETIGDGVETAFAVTHSLDTTDVLVQLWDVSGADPILATGDAQSIEATDADTVTITFGAPPATDAYRVVVLASGGEAGGGARQSRLGVVADELSQTALNAQEAIGSRVVALADVTITQIEAAIAAASDDVRVRVLEVDPPIGNSVVQAVVAETAYIAVSAPERASWSGLSIALEANKTYAIVCEVETGSSLSLYQSQLLLGQNDLISPNNVGFNTTRSVGVSGTLTQYGSSLPIVWLTYVLA